MVSNMGNNFSRNLTFDLVHSISLNKTDPLGVRLNDTRSEQNFEKPQFTLSYFRND